ELGLLDELVEQPVPRGPEIGRAGSGKRLALQLAAPPARREHGGERGPRDRLLAPAPGRVRPPPPRPAPPPPPRPPGPAGESREEAEPSCTHRESRLRGRVTGSARSGLVSVPRLAKRLLRRGILGAWGRRSAFATGGPDRRPQRRQSVPVAGRSCLRPLRSR